MGRRFWITAGLVAAAFCCLSYVVGGSWLNLVLGAANLLMAALWWADGA